MEDLLGSLADRRRRIGHTVEYHASIGSTNDRARQLMDEPDGEGVAVVADEQTAGRGRRGRVWLTPPQASVALSVGLRPRLHAGDAWQLGLAAGLAAHSACSAYADVALKWPNDVVATIDGRKLGGLLIETTSARERLETAIIGIGLNVSWRPDDMPAEIATTATSLVELRGADVDRIELLGRLLDALDHELRAVTDGVSPLERYRAVCVTIGQVVMVAIGERTIEGVAVDVDATGALVVDAPDGRHVIGSGEVVRVARVPGEVPA